MLKCSDLQQTGFWMYYITSALHFSPSSLYKKIKGLEENCCVQSVYFQKIK